MENFRMRVEACELRQTMALIIGTFANWTLQTALSRHGLTGRASSEKVARPCGLHSSRDWPPVPTPEMVAYTSTMVWATLPYPMTATRRTMNACLWEIEQVEHSGSWGAPAAAVHVEFLQRAPMWSVAPCICSPIATTSSALMSMCIFSLTRL